MSWKYSAFIFPADLCFSSLFLCHKLELRVVVWTRDTRWAIAFLPSIHQMKRQQWLDISFTNEYQAEMEKLDCHVYTVKFTVRAQRQTTPFVVLIIWKPIKTAEKKHTLSAPKIRMTATQLYADRNESPWHALTMCNLWRKARQEDAGRQPIIEATGE